MSEPFLAEIRMMGFNFAPRGWAFLDGQILPINQNQSLYSLLGTTYGGDGRTTFALPDLRSRTPVHRADGLFAAETPPDLPYRDEEAGTMTALRSGTVTNGGGGQAHNNMQPYVTLTYCIALRGLFPSRN